jgi:hypothetical protein
LDRHRRSNVDQNGRLLYGRVSEAGFRKIVLGLLLVSGVTLMLSLRQLDLWHWSIR